MSGPDAVVRGPDAVARAHAQLRGMIVRGILAPGSQLSQVELAKRTGVSTTPLRRRGTVMRSASGSSITRAA